MKNERAQLLTILCLIILINLIYFFTQEQVRVNDGKGWDGNIYFAIAEQIAAGDELSGPPPFIYRIGTPYLAYLISPDDLMRGFYLVNLTANIISSILLFFFLKLYFNNFRLIILLMLFFLTHWLCNVRFFYYYPVLTDYWGMTFLLSGLILIEKMKRNNSMILMIVFVLCVTTGILFREYLIILPIAALFCNNPLSADKPFYIDFKKFFYKRTFYFIVLLAGIGITIFLKLFVKSNYDYSIFTSMSEWLYEKSLAEYLNGLFVAIGPVIVILIFFHKEVFEFLKKNQTYAVIFLYCLVISYFGGSDTERFVLWFIPLILLLLGIVIQANSHVFGILFIAILILSQSLASRIFFTTPQPGLSGGLKIPILTLIGDGNYLNLFTMHGNKFFEFAVFVEYCSLIFLMLFLISYAYRKDKTIIK